MRQHLHLLGRVELLGRQNACLIVLHQIEAKRFNRRRATWTNDKHIFSGVSALLIQWMNDCIVDLRIDQTIGCIAVVGFLEVLDHGGQQWGRGVAAIAEKPVSGMAFDVIFQ